MATPTQDSVQEQLLTLLWEKLEAALALSTGRDATERLRDVEILCREAASLALNARLAGQHSA